MCLKNIKWERVEKDCDQALNELPMYPQGERESGPTQFELKRKFLENNLESPPGMEFRCAESSLELSERIAQVY